VLSNTSSIAFSQSSNIITTTTTATAANNTTTTTPSTTMSAATNTTTNNNTTTALIAKLLANNLENHLQQAGSILNVTSKLPQVRNTTYSYLLNETLATLHGIPQNADVEKREVAKNILSSTKDFVAVLFILPNGNVYLDEPFSRQVALSTTNLSFRDYFQGPIRTNDIYLGNTLTSTSLGQRQANLAVPVYSLKDNSTLAGVWSGAINFTTLSKELQSFNLTATASGMRAVYLDHNGNKVADSDVDKSRTNPLESFASLASFKHAAIDGQSGSMIETVDDNNNTKMIVTYQPVKAFHNTWAVLLMQPVQ
jgi:hypothetical protein